MTNLKKSSPSTLKYVFGEKKDGSFCLVATLNGQMLLSNKDQEDISKTIDLNELSLETDGDQKTRDIHRNLVNLQISSTSELSSQKKAAKALTSDKSVIKIKQVGSKIDGLRGLVQDYQTLLNNQQESMITSDIAAKACNKTCDDPQHEMIFRTLNQRNVWCRESYQRSNFATWWVISQDPQSISTSKSKPDDKAKNMITKWIERYGVSIDYGIHNADRIEELQNTTTVPASGDWHELARKFKVMQRSCGTIDASGKRVDDGLNVTQHEWEGIGYKFVLTRSKNNADGGISAGMTIASAGTQLCQNLIEQIKAKGEPVDLRDIITSDSSALAIPSDSGEHNSFQILERIFKDQQVQYNATRNAIIEQTSRAEKSLKKMEGAISVEAVDDFLRAQATKKYIDNMYEPMLDWQLRTLQKAIALEKHLGGGEDDGLLHPDVIEDGDDRPQVDTSLAGWVGKLRDTTLRASPGDCDNLLALQNSLLAMAKHSMDKAKASFDLLDYADERGSIVKQAAEQDALRKLAASRSTITQLLDIAMQYRSKMDEVQIKVRTIDTCGNTCSKPDQHRAEFHAMKRQSSHQQEMTSRFQIALTRLGDKLADDEWSVPGDSLDNLYTTAALARIATEVHLMQSHSSDTKPPCRDLETAIAQYQDGYNDCHAVGDGSNDNGRPTFGFTFLNDAKGNSETYKTIIHIPEANPMFTLDPSTAMVVPTAHLEHTGLDEIDLNSAPIDLTLSGHSPAWEIIDQAFYSLATALDGWDKSTTLQPEDAQLVDYHGKTEDESNLQDKTEKLYFWSMLQSVHKWQLATLEDYEKRLETSVRKHEMSKTSDLGVELKEYRSLWLKTAHLAARETLLGYRLDVMEADPARTESQKNAGIVLSSEAYVEDFGKDDEILAIASEFERVKKSVKDARRDLRKVAEVLGIQDVDTPENLTDLNEFLNRNQKGVTSDDKEDVDHIGENTDHLEGSELDVGSSSDWFPKHQKWTAQWEEHKSALRSRINDKMRHLGPFLLVPGVKHDPKAILTQQGWFTSLSQSALKSRQCKESCCRTTERNERSEHMTGAYLGSASFETANGGDRREAWDILQIEEEIPRRPKKSRRSGKRG